MAAQRRLTAEDIEGLRRSFAMARQLPAQELERLLDDHRVLLVERKNLQALLRELRPSFLSVRSLLNQLDGLLADAAEAAADEDDSAR